MTSEARRLVAGVKYRGWEGLAGVMAERMERVLVGLALPDAPVLVPVPTTRARARARGYNQAERLAHHLGIRRGWPVRDLLVRKGEGPSQVGLPPRYRLSNVNSAFAVTSHRGPGPCSGPVLLVDDVLTTGATLSAASTALSAAGVERVFALTFARAIPGLDDPPS
jgi:predicted amidophosphoribosyltransferase